MVEVLCAANEHGAPDVAARVARAAWRGLGAHSIVVDTVVERALAAQAVVADLATQDLTVPRGKAHDPEIPSAFIGARILDGKIPRVLDPATDLAWWVAVAEEGEQAASSIRQPRLLAELLDLSARVYLTAGLWQAAETAWKRALYLMDKLNDDAEFTRYIEHLAATYRLADRPNYVLQTLERLIEYHETPRNTGQTRPP